MLLAALIHSAALSFVLRTPCSTPCSTPARVAARAMVAEPGAMKLKEIKAELDELGVAWKGVCFEREDLVKALEAARARPAPAKAAAEAADDPPAAAAPAPAAAAPAAAAPAAAAGAAEDSEEYEAAYGEAYEAAMRLKVKELRSALAERSVGSADPNPHPNPNPTPSPSPNPSLNPDPDPDPDPSPSPTPGQVGWADCLEKAELAARLAGLQARRLGA